MTLIHFLLVYDLERQQLVGEPQEFVRADEATAAYSALEREHQKDSNLEVILIGADSFETIKSTHGNYFEDDRDAAGAAYLEAVS
jgi:hypothetical protein